MEMAGDCGLKRRVACLQTPTVGRFRWCGAVNSFASVLFNADVGGSVYNMPWWGLLALGDEKSRTAASEGSVEGEEAVGTRRARPWLPPLAAVRAGQSPPQVTGVSCTAAHDVVRKNEEKPE